MSAGLVDLGNSLTLLPSIQAAAGVGSTPASGEIIGLNCDLRDANNMTSLLISWGPSTSGPFKVQVQTSDTTNSGDFTDPTSGLQRMPTTFLSGGIVVVNSGNNAASGGFFMAGFLRPHRYARARVLSGDQFNSPVNVGLAGASKRTGSGTGVSFSPGSGSVGGF